MRFIMDTKKEQITIAIGGALLGMIAVALSYFGNPANMGFCIACFIRDSAGALGLHRAAAVEYLRPEIIGVVGANWLKGKSDSVLTSFENLDVKVLKVARKDGKNEIGWRPYQYRILTGDYPLIRSVYVILTDPRVRSYTKSFFYFLKGQKGQTIICNSSQLLPYTPVQYKSVRAN